MSEADIEKDIKIVNIMINPRNYIMSDLRECEVRAIENILADRDRLEKMLSKSDADNINLQKEIENLKNDTYWKRIHTKTK